MGSGIIALICVGVATQALFWFMATAMMSLECPRLPLWARIGAGFLWPACILFAVGVGMKAMWDEIMRPSR